MYGDAVDRVRRRDTVRDAVARLRFTFRGRRDAAQLENLFRAPGQVLLPDGGDTTNRGEISVLRRVK
jgi:hypothetical protein